MDLTADDVDPTSARAWRDHEDVQLFERVRAGGPDAARRLFDRYGEDVHRIIRRIMGPDQDHDDAVQDAFIKIVRGASSVREADRLRSWVISVAANTARNRLRARSRFWRRFGGRSAREPVDLAGDVEAHTELRAVYRHLDRLDPDTRTAFVLRYVEQYSLEEVARASGCSLATAKRRIAKARTALRDWGVC